MKKLVLVIAIVFAGMMSANAQVWVGGSASAEFPKGSHAFTITPEVGYMIPKTPFTIAAGLSYTHGYDTINGASNTMVLSPYFRYAPCTIAEKFILFLDLTGDFGLMDAKGAYCVGLQPGIAWMATEKFTAAFRFAYVEYRHGLNPHDIATPTQDGFYANFTLGTPWIGIYYNF